MTAQVPPPVTGRRDREQPMSAAGTGGPGELGRVLLRMVGGAALASAVMTLLAVVVSAVVAGAAAGWSAAAGGAVVVVVFAAGALTIAATADSPPAVTFAIAIAGYGGRVVLLAGVALASARVADVHRTAFAMAAVAVVVIWLTAELVAFRRLTDPRRPGSPTFPAPARTTTAPPRGD